MSDMPQASQEKQKPDPLKLAAEELDRVKHIEAQEAMRSKYRKKGFQRLTLQEYEQLRQREAQRKKPSLPAHIKILFATPFLIIFAFGVFFLPIIIYQIATGRPADKTVGKKSASYSDFLVTEKTK